METGPGAALTAGTTRRRVLLAAAPWGLAVLLLLGGAARRTSDEPATGTPSPRPAAGPTVETVGPDTATTPARPAGVAELRVVAAARAAMGTAGLPGAGPGARRWPLDVRLDEVRAITEDVGVAVVHGLVIEATTEGWSAPTLVTYAVPVGRGPDAPVLGDAWPLTAPPRVARPAARVLDHPGPEVVDALTTAGWLVDEVTEVAVVADVLLRVRLSGVPPDGDAAADHTAWLQDTPDGPRPLLSTPSTDPSPQEPA